MPLRMLLLRWGGFPIGGRVVNNGTDPIFISGPLQLKLGFEHFADDNLARFRFLLPLA